jgi:uncharacterized membrane protein
MVSLFLWLIAFLISTITYFFIREQYISFWIIHFFSLAFFMLIFFRKLWLINIFLWVIFIVYGFYFIPMVSVTYLDFLGFRYPWAFSADYYPLFPYFWVMLLWYSCAVFLSNKKLLWFLSIERNNNMLEIACMYLWKKSLIIYVIHQPIIVWIIYGFSGF